LRCYPNTVQDLADLTPHAPIPFWEGGSNTPLSLQDAAGELTDGPDPSPTPPLRGEGLSGSPFPCREGGWGVRFSEFASGVLAGEGLGERYPLQYWVLPYHSNVLSLGCSR